MIPFLNMRIYRNFSKNLTVFVDKMKQNELKVEDILDEDEIVQDVKSNPSTELMPFFSTEIIKKLIDFSTKMPNVPTDDKTKVDKKIGFKFPFNATEILCSDNATIMDLFVKLNDKNEEESNEKNSEEKNEEEDKKNEEENEKEKVNENEKKDDDEKKDENGKNEEKKEDEEKKVEEKKDEKVDEKKEEEKKDEKKDEKVEEKKEEEKKDEKVEEKKDEDEKEKVEEKKDENKEEKKDEEKKEDEKKEDKKEEEKDEKEKVEEKKEEAQNEEKKEEDQNNDSYEEILPQEIDTTNQKEDTVNQKEDTVNQKEETEIKKDSKSILEYFFDFLATTPNTDSEEIYVLTGYFQRILNHLITSKGSIVIPFIFDSPQNIPDNLIKHLNKKSIAEIVNKILTYNDDSIKDLNEKKKLFITKILQDLNETNIELKFECICSLLISCLDKKEFFNLFMNENSLIELLYSSINKCEGKKLRNLINILIKINENILSNFDKPVTPNLIPENPMDLLNMIKNYGLDNNTEEENQQPSNNEENLKNYLNFLFKVLKENSFAFLDDLNKFEDNNQIETTYQRNQKKLGLKKLAQIEFFRSIIDICVNSYAKKYFTENVEEIIKIANEKNIFWILNEIFLNFEFNNIFQTYYQQLFTIVLNQESPEILINSVFENTKENKKLIPILTEHLLKQMKFKYNSNNEVESGFFSTEIQILDNISTSENIFVKKFIENEENYKVFNECFSSDINSIFKQKLYFNPENDISNPLSNEPENEPFIPNKSLNEIIQEDLNIYNEYKNGGDYKKLIEEKKEREKIEREKFNKENQNNSQEIVNDYDENTDTNVFDSNDDDNELKKEKIYGNDGINYSDWDGEKVINEDELEDLMKELDL